MLTEHHVPMLRFRRFARIFLAAVLLTGWSPAIIRCEDRPRDLPKDGVWVRYRMGGGEVGSEELPMATVTLSLVGTVVEDGVRCRWVESKTVIELPAELAGTVISKVLVSENDLLESEKPFAHVHRRWMRIRDEPVKQAPNEVSAASYERLVLWTPGMLKGSEPAKDEAKVIDYQRGQIKNAQARTGQLIYKQPAPDKKEMRFVSKYTVWQHSDVSFGFAEARIVSEQFHDNKKMGQTSVVYYRLQDMGTDAKSELPDSN